MLSMPPATMTSPVPARSASWASITAFMPEPHILLRVVAGTSFGRPGREARLARRRLALAGGQHAAHQELVDRVRLDAGTRQRRGDGGAAELGGGGRQPARPGSRPSGCGRRRR